MSQFQTSKNRITSTRLVAAGSNPADFELTEGDILVAVERFAFTANNVTYGAVGHQIGYWQFFPPHLTADDDADWGIVPVWGFARIVASRNPDLQEGERLYGYLPIANYLQIKPTNLSPERLMDGASHRKQLPPVYNNYDRLGSGLGDSEVENFRALLKPLYVTSFCLCDALQQESYYSADQVVIVSASSKTAIGLAYGLSQLTGKRPEIVGLTSDANVAFVQSTGLYDRVLGYGALDRLANRPSVLVDMSGNRAVLGQVHALLGDNMRYCHNVGLTHWDDSVTKNDPKAGSIIQERSAMFFAPSHIQNRAAEWGAVVFNQKADAFLAAATEHASTWMQVREIHGLEAFSKVYDAVVGGDMTPSEGLIVSP